MYHLGVDDFHKYYVNSFVLDPETGQPAFVIGFETRDTVRLQTSSNGNSFKNVPFSAFGWEKSGKYPELGYRTAGDGVAVLWLARKAGNLQINGARKGLRPETLVTSYPEALTVIGMANRRTSDALVARYTGWPLAELVFNSSFQSLEQAAKRLLDQKDKAVSFALSPEFAVTLWPMKDANLAMYFGGQKHPAALSDDGDTWNWSNVCAKDVALRKGIVK